MALRGQQLVAELTYPYVEVQQVQILVASYTNPGLQVQTLFVTGLTAIVVGQLAIKIHTKVGALATL